MKDLDYTLIFKAAQTLMADVDPAKAEADVHHLEKEESEFFDTYFKSTLMTKKVDLQGHHMGVYDGHTLQEIKDTMEYDYLVERYCDQIKFSISYKFFGEILKNKEALKNDVDNVIQEKIIQEFIKTLEASFLTVEHYCFVCGVTTRSSYNNGLFTSVVSDDSRMGKFAGHQPCKLPKGLAEYSYNVNIPSGKLLFANDLRELFPDLSRFEVNTYITEKSGYNNNVNSDLGVMYSQEFWNNHGMIYVQVGNTSPHVFQDTVTQNIEVKFDSVYKPQERDDELKFNDSDDEDEDGEDPDYVKNYTATEKDLGYICTDLWAVCAIDHDLMKTLCEKHHINFEELSGSCIAVTVEPGEYIVHSFNAASYACKNTFFNIKKAT